MIYLNDDILHFDFEASPTDSAVLALLSELSEDPEIDHFDFLGAYAEK